MHLLQAHLYSDVLEPCTVHGLHSLGILMLSFEDMSYLRAKTAMKALRFLTFICPFSELLVGLGLLDDVQDGRRQLYHQHRQSDKGFVGRQIIP